MRFASSKFCPLRKKRVDWLPEEPDVYKRQTQAIAAVLAIGLLISVVGSLYLRQIAYLFGATEKIVGYVTAYLRPINSLAFIYMLSSSLTVIVRSDGNPKLVMLACTSGNVANILLDYLFVKMCIRDRSWSRAGKSGRSRISGTRPTCPDCASPLI